MIIAYSLREEKQITYSNIISIENIILSIVYVSPRMKHCQLNYLSTEILVEKIFSIFLML